MCDRLGHLPLLHRGRIHFLRGIVLSLVTLSLAACGGGGGDDPTPLPPVNQPPVANAGADQNVTTGSMVALGGTGIDPNGDELTYSWTQTSGAAVTISNANMATAGFQAPATPGTLEFQLLVSDGNLTSTDLVTVMALDPLSLVSVSGRVNYEFVPANPNCAGLDFDSIEVRPVRRATVQILSGASETVIASTTADELGDYSFANIQGGIDVRLRIRAELKRSGSPAWDVEVRDNLDSSGTPLQLRPLYVVDGAIFNTGGSNITNRNLTATTGWGSSSYTGDRAAAPFAILDAMYSGMQLVLATEPTAVFPPLDAFWSIDNTTAMGTTEDGGIGTSYYNSNPDGGTPNPSLFLLGDADEDTEEFDDHVVLHEWGHYFEDNFSRSDSIGGQHGLGDSLDPRVAFGEGFATALAAIGLDDPQYCDTGIPGAASGFGIDAENGNLGIQGWFNELSVVTLLYDLYDTNVDGTDTSSIGFEPILATMLGPQASTAAFTSIFSFAASLRPMLGTPEQLFLDSQLTREDISTAGLDIWGNNETNQPPGARDVLPVYTDFIANGGVTNICTNSDFDRPDRTGNKLAEHRFLRLTVPVSDTYDVLVQTTTITPITMDPDDRDQADPDIYIYDSGELVAVGDSPAENLESFTTQTVLQAGTTYTVDLEDWRFADDEGAPANYPEQICFNVSFTQSP